MPAAASPGLPPLLLEGELTIYTAAAVKAALPLQPLTGALRLDLGGVTDLDTAGVQLLALLARHARGQNVPFHITAASAPVREILLLCGLEEWLPPGRESV